jgi:hypothetical protein
LLAAVVAVMKVEHLLVLLALAVLAAEELVQIITHLLLVHPVEQIQAAVVAVLQTELVLDMLAVQVLLSFDMQSK